MRLMTNNLNSYRVYNDVIIPHVTNNYDKIGEECVVLSIMTNRHLYVAATFYLHSKSYEFDGDVTLRNDIFRYHVKEDTQDFVHDYQDNPFYIWKSYECYHCFNILCIYINIDAVIMFGREQITMQDYEDPYVDDEVYEGTIENILQFPRVVTHCGETYVRNSLSSKFSVIISTHKILCYIHSNS